MKVGKKLLSVFLAVIMIMSSMSVCFGVEVFAKPADATATDYQELAAALRKDPMKYAEYTLPTASATGRRESTVTDKTGYFFTAAAEWYDVFVKVWDAPSTSGKNDSGVGVYRLSDSINSGILSQLQDGGYLTASEITNLKVEDFLKLMVGNVTPNHAVEKKGLLSTPSITGCTGVCIITLDLTAYLTSFKSISDIPSSFPTAATYTTVNNDNVNHKVSYSTYYYAAIQGTQHMTESVTTNSTIKTELANAYTALSSTHNYYFGDNELIDVVRKGKSNLESAKTAINNAYNTVYNSTTYTGKDVWAKYFASFDTETAVAGINDALSVHAWEGTVNAYKAALATDYSAYTSTELFALYNTLVTYRDSIDNAQFSAEIKEYFGIDTTANQAYIDTLKAYYDDKVIAEHRDIALELFEQYKDWTPEMVYNGEISEADLIQAAAKLDTEHVIFAACDPATVDRICGDGFMEQFEAVYDTVDALAAAIAAQKNFLEAKEKFDNEVKPATPADADFDTLFANVQNYDQWYSNLKDYVEAIRVAYGDELADAIMQHYDEVMMEHMDAAYKVLSDVSEAEIDIAYEVYGEYVEIYGEGGTFGLLNNLFRVYDQLQESIGTVNADLYDFLIASENDALSEEAIAKFESMKNIIKAYTNFDETKGFDVYQPSSIDDIVREESDKDIAREGDYTVTDEKVLEIIDTLENVLADDKIKALLGDLINKDEDGNPTGEAFDIGALVTSLIEDNLYSDSLINTIIQFIYPAVANIFTEVWMGINPVINDPKMKVMGQEVSVSANLYLNTVEEATEGLGLPIFPVSLANTIKTAYPQFTDVANVLDDATTASYVAKDAEGKWDESTRKSPWNDAALYTAKLDENNNPVVNEETGETTMVLALDWGIDKLEGAAKRERFLQAIQAALIGLEPILLSLLCNASTNLFNESIGTGYGQDGLNNFYVGDVVFWSDVTLSGIELDIHTIDLRLKATPNDGYNNVIAPLFELLGVTAPNGKTFTSTRDVIEKGLLEPLDTFIAKLSANPIETILDILPNLAYAIEADLLLSKLDYLETQIVYSAGATINADLNNCTSNVGLISSLLPYLDGVVTSMTGLACEGGVIQNVRVDNVVHNTDPNSDNPPLDVAISTFLDINSLLGEDVDLSSFAGVWNLIAGLIGEGAKDVKAPNGQLLATMGELKWINTVRSIKSYNYGADGKAAHIQANRADVLIFLVRYALSSGLLGALVAEPDELVNTIFTNLATNTDDAIAAIVEILKAVKYDTLEEYEWYNGIYTPADDLNFTPAAQIYMNPGNDWTPEKAEYLYNNLEAILAAIFGLAGLDLDDTTEEVDGSIEAALGGLIGGLFTNKTITDLAKLLGSISDLNALLAPKAEEGEAADGEETPDANEPETVAEGEEATEGDAEAAAPAIDLNQLVKDILGIDLSAFAAYKDLADDTTWGFVDGNAAGFVNALVSLLAPLSDVLDFVLADGNLTLTLAENETVTLYGNDGYNTAIVPLLEALGCEVTAATTGSAALTATLNALVGLINKLTTNTEDNKKDGAIYGIIDLLPGLFYFLTSNGLSTTVRNLLHPVYVILDTIRPIYDVDLEALINGIVIKNEEEGTEKTVAELLGTEIDFEKLDGGFVVKLISGLTGLNLAELETLIYDVADDFATPYISLSELANTVEYTGEAEDEKVMKAHKGAYNDKFTQADLLTVLLSFVLEWATVKENAEALDTLLGTDGIIAALNTVFADVKIEYGTPKWMYWFETEEAFNAHVNGENPLPNTLYALEYPNDWTETKAQYIAKELPSLVDMIIGLINQDKADAPATLSALLNKLIADNINADTLNDLVAMIAGLLEGVDNNLLELAGVLLSDSETDKIDIVGLKGYTCTKEITTLGGFINELANVLDTYASGLVDWLFFGDDFRFAKKSDKTDTIVINGGKGYEMGLAMILEALGCTLPAEANTKSVLGALATRVDAILANPVDEVIGLLPNLIYFLNANGAGVAVDNLLQPVYALLTKLEAFGLNINIADLLAGIEVNGEPLELDLANLSLANVVEILKKVLPGFDFTVVEDYLVNFCTGKITKGTYIYKMTAPKEDVVTIILTIALLFVKDEANAAKLDEMLNTDIISALDEVFASTPVEYIYPDYNYFDGEIDVDEGTIKVMENAITYPNDWTEEKSAEIAKNLPVLVDAVIKMIAINGVKYDSLEALLNSLLSEANVFSAKTLNDLVDLIAKLLANVDDELLKFGALLNVKLVDTVDAEGNVIDKGLKSYVAPESIDTVEEFATELAYILNTYAKGIVEWLLLGDDIKLGVSDVDAKGTKLEGEDIITINGAYGYAEGLALLLEALGCENLPAADAETEDIVSGVLASLAARISDILSNDVDENGNVTKTVVDKILELLPNIVYFLNANGVAAVVNNTAGAFNALALKLKSFGLNITLDDLVNLPKLMKIEDKYVEGDDVIGLDNITIKSLLKAVSLMTGLDLTVLNDVLTGFALGEVKAYDSVSSLGYTAKMEYTKAKDKHDMITVLVTAALLTIVENEDNAAKLDEMLGLEPGIISALKDVFAEGTISYEKPNWDYNIADNGTVDAMKYSITYPNNWTEETALYVTEVLTSDDFDKLITGLIDSNYASLGDLLTAKVNVFTSANLQSIVDLLVNLLKDIDDGLLDAAGLLLDVDVVGLKNHKIPADIDTVEEFAAELAIILNAYAKGVVEWLLLGNDYRFFVKDVAKNEAGETIPVDFIVINGAEGYANGLALLLEALGCKNLPAVYDENGEALDLDTTAVVNGVLNSLAARISEIFADPIEEVINLLPNLLYFLNTNGVAAVIDNTLAALTALLNKLEAFNIKVDINELVNLKKLMKIENTDAKISLDNLTVEDLLEAVSYMVKDLDLTIVKNVIVNFGLVKAEAYESVSDKNAVGEAKKMGYEKDVFETHDMVTVLANLVLLAVADKGNEKFLKNLIKNDEIYDMIIALFNMEEDAMQEFSWIFISEETGGNKVGQTFSTLETSEEYEDWPLYGPFYTEEMATYIADNFGMFVDNIIYLLGLNINGVQVNTLTELINTLLDGSLYNSSNVIAIRDALAGVLANVENLEVNGQNVGKYIVNVLAKAEVADIAAVKAVNVPEFEKDREKFVASLCDVLEPLYPVLKYVLADKDIAFFAKTDESSLITLKGAEGYAYGIIPLLETLECEGILTPAEYYAAVEADGDVLLTSILTPLLNRVDEIIENPADEILAILPNLIYFINSNGLDTVVNNTLNAVFNLLAVIKPVAKIDLYELIGVDLAEINMTWLVKKLADILAKAGYEFDINAFDPIAELTVGKLEAYTSLNGKTAYRMVYAPENADGTPASGGKEELVTVVLRLLITFLMHEKNAEIIVDFLVGELGMDPAAKDYLNRLFKSIANVPTTTYIGMNQAQAVIYYLFYSADIGASELVGGFKDIGAEWGKVLNEIGGTGPDSLGGILNDLLGDDIIDSDRFAPSGLIGFFQKIINWFNKIIEWFKNLFN